MEAAGGHTNGGGQTDEGKAPSSDVQVGYMDNLSKETVTRDFYLWFVTSEAQVSEP